jgi:oligoendopeptidase F
MRRAFEERSVDVYGHEGKTGGGSLTHVPGIHPFGLLEYEGSFFDLLTVAHELGHALHYVLSEKNQPFAAAEPPYLLTEIPSTFDEVLLVRHLLDRTPDPATRRVLLAELLDRLDTLLVFGARVAELENAMHAHVESGGTLTAEWLDATFLAIARSTCGHEKGLVLVDDYVKSGWNYPITFFDTFRGYKVVLATVASLAMAESVLGGGEAEARQYVRFLGAGCSGSPVETLKDAGVDLTRPEKAEAAMGAFDRLVSELEVLQGRLEAERTPSP